MTITSETKETEEDVFNDVYRSGPGFRLSRATSFVQWGSKLYGEGGDPVKVKVTWLVEGSCWFQFSSENSSLNKAAPGRRTRKLWRLTCTGKYGDSAQVSMTLLSRKARKKDGKEGGGWILQWTDGNSISRKLVYRFAAPTVCLAIVRSRSCHFGCAFEVDQERYLRVAETWRREEREERANVFLEYLQLIAYRART